MKLGNLNLFHLEWLSLFKVFVSKPRVVKITPASVIGGVWHSWQLELIR